MLNFIQTKTEMILNTGISLGYGRLACREFDCFVYFILFI